jgi:ribosome-binding factor A
VEAELRDVLARSLQQLDDPRLLGVGITSVEVSPDLQSARVYVRLIFGNDGPTLRRELLRGLDAANGRLRRDLALHLRLRRQPTLRFVYDEQPDRAHRVDDLLDEIARDAEPPKG